MYIIFKSMWYQFYFQISFPDFSQGVENIMAKKTDSNNFPIPVQTRLAISTTTNECTAQWWFKKLREPWRRWAQKCFESQRDAEMKRHSTSLSPAGLQNFIRSKTCSSLPKMHRSQRSLFRLLINFCLIRAFEFNS